MQRIDVDVHCLRCGYNLRTLNRDAMCPECGGEIHASVVAFESRDEPLAGLRKRGEPWLRRVRNDVTLAAVANLMSFGIGVLCGDRGVPFIDTRDWLRALTWLTPVVVAFVVSCWAAWRLAATMRPVGRFVARCAVTLTVIGLGFTFLNSRWLAAYADVHWWTAERLDARILWPTRRVASLLLVTALPASIGFTLFTAARLFALAGRSWLASTLRVTCVLIAVFVILVAPGLLSGPELDRVGSVELLLITTSPTVALPFVGAVLRAVSTSGDGNLLVLGVSLAFAAVMSWPFVLRATLSRAIALGGLPAASSRSSPAPRPPA